MYRYLITLKPMESYFFGGERTFGFGKKIINGANVTPPYYIVSEDTPSQTTLFGTLRYIILAQNNALLDGNETSEEKKMKHEKLKELVGEYSFSFEKALNGNEQKYGYIEKISPLFLMKKGAEKDIWLVPTPMNHNSNGKHYKPFIMGSAENSITFGNGTTLYPADYSAKTGYGKGYISADESLHIFGNDEIFSSDDRVGINSHRTDDVFVKDNDKSFFKKNRKMLADGFNFAFIAELNNTIKCEENVVFMGQDRSPFLCTIQKTEESLASKVKNAFGRKCNEQVLYALSDVMPVSEKFPCNDDKLDFYIANTKVMRNLETNVASSSYYGRLKKSEKLYKLMTHGSVFYTRLNDLLKNDHLEKIGLNVLIRI